MSSRQGGDNNGVMSWVLISLACLGVMGTMAWIVGSHAIVYYTAPLFKWLGAIWYIIPQPLAGTSVMDVEVNYQLFRQHAAIINFPEWVEFANLAMKPYSYLFVLGALALFVRQSKKVKARQLNERLTPNGLALKMMNVFSDIAPVVSIQEKIVANALPGWRRQTFPEEFIKGLRYQGKTVLLPDPDAVRTDGDRGLMIDESRLIGALTITKKYKHEGVTLLRSPFLGRQIVNLVKDTGAAKAGKSIVYVDRLSDVGKAVFAILAPYAFGAKKGRDQSASVINALNYSAYGSSDGAANLSVPEASESFNQWREHAMVQRLAKVHHWEYTFLFALLEQARRSGKIGTWSFIWLKPMNRTMFYVLNSCGRKTPHSEAGLAFSQVQYEQAVMRKGRIPLLPTGEHRIFTAQLVRSLVDVWEAWRIGEDDNDDWWKDETLFDIEANLGLMAELQSAGQVPDLPPASANI